MPPKPSNTTTGASTSGAGTTEEENSSKDGFWNKKAFKIALAVTTVAAVTVPIVCNLLCKEKEEEDEEKDVNYTGSAMLDKLVGWVKEFKGSNSGEEEEAKEVAKYEEITSVPEFVRAQSL